MTTIGGGALTQQLYGKLFDRLDVDANLGLTRDEFKAADSGRSDEAFAAAFEKLDADQDGKISRAEMSAGPTLSLGTDALLTTSGADNPVAELIARADTDGDGKLSASENEAEAALRRAANLDSGYIGGPIFMLRDRDGDGLYAADEISAARPLPSKGLTVVFPDELPEELRAALRDLDGAAPSSAKTYTAEEKQAIRDQMAADAAERTSGPEGTLKFLGREITGLRERAAGDFAKLEIGKTLSSRLLAQILGGLDQAA